MRTVAYVDRLLTTDMPEAWEMLWGPEQWIQVQGMEFAGDVGMQVIVDLCERLKARDAAGIVRIPPRVAKGWKPIDSLY